MWQQRPETPALIRRIDPSSSHHAPHQCSDSAEEWIKPASNHPPRRRTASPATTARVHSIANLTTRLSDEIKRRGKRHPYIRGTNTQLDQSLHA